MARAETSLMDTLHRALGNEAFKRAAEIVEPEPVLPAIRSPWLSVVDAAKHAGWKCSNDRAPQSFYDLAHQIGSKVNGKWRIHVDDLDTWIRSHGPVSA